jgi:hypothetical protein
MNERIKQLAEQAGEYVNEVYTPPVRSKTPGKIWEDGHIEWHTQFNQKFAELIVKECCQYLENEAERLYNLSGTENDPAFQSNFEICAEKCYDNVEGLKEHFGVEE